MKPKDSERIKLYRSHRNKVGEALLRSVLRALASAEAGEMITEILQVNLKLDGLELDKKELDANIMKILRSELASILIDNSILSEKERDRLSRRILSQIAPMRDNIMPLVPHVPERKRLEELGDVINATVKRELNNFEKSRQSR